MADEKKSSGARELKLDALVEKVVPDASQIPDLLVLVGLVGKSSRAGYVRLYVRANLSEYFDISEKDVVHSQSLANEVSPLGGSIVWVRREANLLHSRTQPTQVQAEFIQGDITTAFLPGSSLGVHPEWAPALRAARDPSVVDMSCRLGICESKQGYCFPSRVPAVCF